MSEMRLGRSAALSAKAHDLIPGGAHTYARGDDQYPANLNPIIARGAGSHVWDVDGNEYIEYGMGLRSVTLGHGHPSVVQAAREAMEKGTNFVRPTEIEVLAAEDVLGFVNAADMVKFAKNGSDATTGALKLARAYTGRDMVAVCGGFLSVDDWFIGTTTLNGGIPKTVSDLTITFPYNDLGTLASIFDEFPGRVSCVLMEGEKDQLPEHGFLQAVQELCHANGALFILDEMINGLRIAMAGAQEFHGIEPDLSTFGKALANGFSVSALAGKRDIMSLGSLSRREESRVFLLSYTHGAETHALAAMREVIATYRREGVIERMNVLGNRLEAGVQAAATDHGVHQYFTLKGRPSNLVYGTADGAGRASQEFRTLFMQETIRRGLLAPSLVVSAAHSEDDIDRTIEIVHAALAVYSEALATGIGRYLEGRSVRPVFPPKAMEHTGIAASIAAQAD